MYNSGILPDIIAMQLDISKDEVYQIIKNAASEEERKKASVKQVSNASSLGMFYLDAVVNIDLSIKHAQDTMWKALKGVPEFNISMEETQNVLESYAKSKVTLVILHIDLVGSTRLSMTLPVDRLATIIQAFTQEMSLIIAAYGGYVLKFVGDAILAFFPVNLDDLYLPCINAVNCARSMIKIMRQGMNPILNQYDYPEMGVRVGIDVGENVVVQYGLDIRTYTIENKQILKKPHLDILGYTISIAVKMTAFAKSDQIIIGQLVYDRLDATQKYAFKVLPVSSDVWSYVSNNSGYIYSLYGSIKE
ncbi:MAG: adenylate/guanylate cyclase domain-containing protein [Nitrososphaeraceae archaeon]|nr:adenylate/guanylate cyclase domain-containing protein [Nitrososphaeraceae archaeon]MDQ3983866.1 adenylate/guanylate cyclase domain-containing protein [Thermoproteota archaeon]